MTPSFSQAEELFAKNRFMESLEVVQQLLAEQPDQSTLLAFQALCWVRLKALTSAEESILKAIKLDPNLDFAYFVRANLELERGRPREAEKQISLAIDINPIQAEYHGLLALCLFHRHASADEVRDASRRGLNFDPGNNLCQNVLSMVELRTGKPELATTIMEFNLEKNPASGFSLANQGWNYLHQGKPQEAATFFEKALLRESDHEWARLGYLQSLKCRFPFYRFLLRSLLILSRLSPAKRFAVIFGLYSIPLALSLAGHLDGLGGSVATGFLVMAVYIGWLGDSLASFALRLTPEGKKWMKPWEKRRSVALTSVLVVSLLSLCIYIASRFEVFAILSLGLFLFSIPLGLILVDDKKNRRQIGIGILSVLALMGVAFMLMYMGLLPVGEHGKYLSMLGQGYLGAVFVYCLSLLLVRS